MKRTLIPSPSPTNYPARKDAIEFHDLVRITRRLGMKARSVTVLPDQLSKAPVPFIAQGHNNEFFIVADVSPDQETVLVQFAGQAAVTLPVSELWEQWSGEALWMTRRFDLSHTLKRFGISWFVPVIIKYRRVLGEVVLASFFPAAVRPGDAGLLPGGAGHLAHVSVLPHQLPGGRGAGQPPV